MNLNCFCDRTIRNTFQISQDFVQVSLDGYIRDRSSDPLFFDKGEPMYLKIENDSPGNIDFIIEMEPAFPAEYYFVGPYQPFNKIYPAKASRNYRLRLKCTSPSGCIARGILSKVPL